MPFREPMVVFTSKPTNPSIDLDHDDWGDKVPLIKGHHNAPYDHLQSDLTDVRNQQGVLQDQLAALVEAINLQTEMKKNEETEK